MADAVAAGKFPALLGLLRGFDVLVGNKVIQNDGDFVLVKNLRKAVFGKLVNGHWGGNVVAQDDVQLGTDQLSGADAV